MSDINRVAFGTNHDGVNTKTMILTRHFTFSRFQIQNGVIAAAMPIVHFVSRHVERARKQLMPKTNAKKWLIRSQNFFNCFDGVIHRPRVARSIR